MHRLPLSFALLTCCGYWRPTTWQPGSIKYYLYNVYSVFMILVLYFFTFCAIVDSATSKDFRTMSDKFSLVISVFGVCLKVTNLFIQRVKIIDLMNTLLNENCDPRDEEEKIIQRRNDNYARRLTTYCEILNELAVFFATVAQYKSFIKQKTLPVADWVPYDLSSDKLFIMSLIYQTVGLMICANTSVANETLISGLMIQSGGQFEILCHRARNLTFSTMEASRTVQSKKDMRIRYRKILRNLVEYHLDVCKFAQTISSVFQYIIFLQFSISSTVLCLSIYKMSIVEPFSFKFVWSFTYLCCMLMQVYLYCWFGNEVTLKSDKLCDAIYEMNWTVLPAYLMRDLLIIMTRSRRSIKMTGGYIVILSADSFMAIMKITYSSYNLLSNFTNK